jgi:hypothetical protein
MDSYSWMVDYEWSLKVTTNIGTKKFGVLLSARKQCPQVTGVDKKTHGITGNNIRRQGNNNRNTINKFSISNNIMSRAVSNTR